MCSSDLVDGDAVLHGEYLDTSHFSTLHDFPLPVILDGECTRLDFSINNVTYENLF